MEDRQGPVGAAARPPEALLDGLLEATRKGLFVPLGQGDAGIGGVLHALTEHGYQGWLVLEQDTAITGAEPAVGSGPVLDQRSSIAFLHNSARATQEVNE